MLKELEVFYLDIIQKEHIKYFADKIWLKYKFYIKKKYFRKFTARIWKRYSRYMVLRSYLINKNLWYSGKKGILLNYKSYKLKPITNLNCLQIKIISLISDIIKKFK